MSKPMFFLALAILFPVFALAVMVNQEEVVYLDLIQQAAVLEVLWLGLSYLGWLGSRWQRGHWNAEALSASSERRRFLLVGMFIGALVSVWGGYLRIVERVIW